MTKLSILRAVAHDLADSFGSGASMLFRFYDFDPYLEANRCASGSLEVDFVSGRVDGTDLPFRLAEEIGSRRALRELCRKYRVDSETLTSVRARFSVELLHPTVTVVVEDVDGRVAADTYVGRPARRRRIVDPLGRIRTVRKRTSIDGDDGLVGRT